MLIEEIETNRKKFHFKKKENLSHLPMEALLFQCLRRPGKTLHTSEGLIPYLEQYGAKEKSSQNNAIAHVHTFLDINN